MNGFNSLSNLAPSELYFDHYYLIGDQIWNYNVIEESHPNRYKDPIRNPFFHGLWCVNMICEKECLCVLSDITSEIKHIRFEEILELNEKSRNMTLIFSDNLNLSLDEKFKIKRKIGEFFCEYSQISRSIQFVLNVKNNFPDQKFKNYEGIMKKELHKHFGTIVGTLIEEFNKLQIFRNNLTHKLFKFLRENSKDCIQIIANHINGVIELNRNILHLLITPSSLGVSNYKWIVYCMLI